VGELATVVQLPQRAFNLANLTQATLSVRLASLRGGIAPTTSVAAIDG
jgi:hypothetical protein